MSKKESESLSQVVKKKKKNPQVTSGMGLKKKNTHTIETYEQIKQISFGLNTRI